MMGVQIQLGLVFAAALLLACAYSVPGTSELISPDDPEALKAAGFAMAEYNKASNDMFLHKVVSIVSAQRQIVAGIKYILEVEVGKTQCRQGEVDDLDSCALHAIPKKQLCNFEVVVIPWLEDISLPKSMCTPFE
uniref:cystatin-like n=1 Tax=Pristiophorus japonicus TaxID=55135 RepID=UPI00398ECA2D